MSRLQRKKKPKERTFERNMRRLTPFSVFFMLFVIIGMWILIWFAVSSDENGNVIYPKWFVVMPWCLLWAIIIFSAGLIVYIWRDRARRIMTKGWQSTIGAYPILFVTNEVKDEKTNGIVEQSYTGIAVGGTVDEDMFVLTKPRKILVTPSAYVNDYDAGGLAIDIHTDPTPFEELPESVKSAIIQCGGRVRFDPEVDKVEFSRDFNPPKNKGTVRSYQKYDLALRQLSSENKSLKGLLMDKEATIRGMNRERLLDVNNRIGGGVNPNERDDISEDMNLRTRNPR